MGIAENIRRFRSLIPSYVEMVAVSKFHPTEIILEAYNAGQRLFGESRVQEFLEKEKKLPKDINWHFIGHLQTNKVKSIIGKTALIESVDSLKLLDCLEKESGNAGCDTEILLQVHIADEDTKFGFYPDELTALFREGSFDGLKYVKIRGLMGMATNTENRDIVRRDFLRLHDIFQEVKADYTKNIAKFDKLSMGMSGDWPIAVEEGANIVRIGSAIFRDRIYK